MKMRFLLLPPLVVLAACAPDIDRETAELSAYYARKGDEMARSLQSADKSDAKAVKPAGTDSTAKPKTTN
jgi:hypothetical protein